MTKLSAEQLIVANLTDDYIRDLEPENQRYDITLAGDFVISVLPNGIKTWAFIYDFQGRQRRKTLGVFPDMNFGEAKAALERARNAMIRMDEPTEPPDEFSRRPAVLGGGRYVPKSPRRRNYKKLLKIGAVLALLLALGLAGLWWKNRPPTVKETPPVPATKSTSPFAVSTERTNTRAANKETNPASEARVNEAAATSDTETATATEQAAQNTNLTPTASIEPVVSTIDEPDNEQLSSSTNVLLNPPESTPNETIGANARAATNEFTQSASTASTSSTETEAPSPTPSSAPAVGATAYGGRVARSRMTGKIVDLEPMDTIGPEISYKNSGFTRVFYYTELREFSDGNVVHRWELNDEVIDEVVLRVRKSWRWRTYSSKDLTPGLSGTWQVSTIDATGAILDTETFTYEAR